MRLIDKICEELNCDVNDIVEHIADENVESEEKE